MKTLNKKQLTELETLYREHIAFNEFITIENFCELYFYICPICGKTFNSFKSGFGVNGKGETVCRKCFK